MTSRDGAPLSRAQTLEAELREARYQEAMEAHAARRCRACNEPTMERGGEKGYLTDFEITIARSEEGHSHIDSQVCEECLIKVTEALAGVGISIHAHGGICFLEATDCPGVNRPDECPTPEEQYPD